MEIHKKRLILIFALLIILPVVCYSELQKIHSVPPFGDALKKWEGWGSWGAPEYCPAGEFAYSFRIWYVPHQEGCPWWIRCDDTGANALELSCTSEGGKRPNPNSRSIISSKKGPFFKKATKWHDCKDGYYLYSYQIAVEHPKGRIRDIPLEPNAIIPRSTDDTSKLRHTFGRPQGTIPRNTNDINILRHIFGLPPDTIPRDTNDAALNRVRFELFSRSIIASSIIAFTDDTALNGVRFECKNPESMDIQKNLESIPVGGDYSRWGSSAFCKDGNYVSGIEARAEKEQGAWGDDTGLVDVKLYCTTR